jgi:transcriptional regulator with XRE-family HTH domain
VVVNTGASLALRCAAPHRVGAAAPSKLAANSRRLREQAQLTLEEAAHRAGINWRHWQKIESREVNLTLASLARVADALARRTDS